MAILFDDASSEGYTFDGPVPNTYPLTLSAWIRPDAAPAASLSIGLGDKDVDTHTCMLYVSPGSAYAWHNAYGGASSLQASFGTAPTLNTWTHQWGSYEKSGADHLLKTSLNNATAATATSSNPSDFTNNDEWWVGGRFSATPATFFSGYLAEVAAWGALLSADEKAALAAGFSPLFIQPQNLLFYAPLRSQALDIMNTDRTITTEGTPVLSPGIHPNIIYPSNVQVMAAQAAVASTTMAPYYYQLMQGAAA